MVKDIKIMFVTDLHGSERTYRKALNASKLYEVDYLIIGGDITAKKFLFVERENGKYLLDGKETKLEEVSEEASIIGAYMVTGDRNELEVFKSEEAFQKIYREKVETQLTKWINLMDEKLKDSKIRVFWSIGNDDPQFVDEILKSNGIETEGILEMDGTSNSLYLLSYGYVNPTPFNSYREVPDSDIYIKGRDMLSQVDPSRVILNFHAPPYGTKLDLAIIDGERRHVGSKSVYDLEDRFSPLLGLHGHIHESPATDKVGKTIVVNPGSQAYEGILRFGLIVISREIKGIVMKYKVKASTILTG
ncbi:metallophosphoesterase [Acidianus sp. RZ1]|uniref:metallophosphoesterase family protein n=1 Tax=Acidianus sp. RZ1 TaxID=1540082 RepID=UPI00149267D5|nr:metallophosphoesterase [Acidianus sp. RZ1]NON61327.1 metallophosphoesterase [Acidianus sp. RZ1]